ncbi:MAG: hypothetical protein JST16_08290 [Bdellovibrionales bacterium]|nr:hypothetical protein [Bdellovibrionales bacterium]
MRSLFFRSLFLVGSANAVAQSSSPLIASVWVDGKQVWTAEGPASFTLLPSQKVTLRGTGFGAGPDVDYSKIMIGNSRVLERDLPFFEGKLNLLTKDFYETSKLREVEYSDILRWNDGEVVFRVPTHAHSGNLSLQVQRRTGYNFSLSDLGKPHIVFDPLTERITHETYVRKSAGIDTLGTAAQSNAIPVEVNNGNFEQMRTLGEAIFWSYDFNIGMTHHLVGLDWYKIMKGEAKDPVTGLLATPALFGAIPLTAGEVPAVATTGFNFDPYPMVTPMKPIWGAPAPLTKGPGLPTGYVGFISGQAVNPITSQKEMHIGFSCISCHAQAVQYEDRPGHLVKQVVPGLPNPDWNMKWTVLGNFEGVKGTEKINGKNMKVDKTFLLYNLPSGTGEHTIVRLNTAPGRYGNDNLYSPTAIPVITRHTPVRRALSRTEMVAGFEGSYMHSQEPDGAIGVMDSQSLAALTAYMTTLDRNDEALNRVGLYRTLASKGARGDIDSVSEGEFVQRGPDAFPKLVSRLTRGADIYGRYCISCHANNYGTNTDENMLPLSQVGMYFSPTIFNRETQSVRTAMLRNVYWVAKRGLLRDGHVKTLEDLLNPDRLRTDSDLYKKYYTLHPGSFHIPKGNAAQEAAARNHVYFVDVPWATDQLYWDYQKMLREFGPRELGSTTHVSLPAAPHPWTVERADEMDDLILYLMTL